MNKFFGYTKYYSVTEMLLTLRLPSFDTVIHNYKFATKLFPRATMLYKVMHIDATLARLEMQRCSYKDH